MNFEFNEENKILAQKEIDKYPVGKEQSAVMALLTLAQKQNENNYLSKEAIDYVACYLNMPPIKVMEVATFYSMYNLHPIGKYHIQVCSNVVCDVRGSDSLISILKNITGADINCTSPDGLFTLSKVECLGACANAPVVQINDTYFEDVNSENIKTIICELKENREPNYKNMVKVSKLATENK